MHWVEKRLHQNVNGIQPWNIFEVSPHKMKVHWKYVEEKTENKYEYEGKNNIM